jgi:zinc D-Ala-D-Ala carboxypeptidase
MTLSRHFTLDEFIASSVAARKGIDNTPSPEIQGALLNTAAGMERVRSVLGGYPIRINSGYRCQKLNSIIGGSPNSQHTKGEAADFICPEFGMPVDIAHALSTHFPDIGWDQLILEFDQWIHISFVTESPRGKILTINRRGTFPGIGG